MYKAAAFFILVFLASFLFSSSIETVPNSLKKIDQEYHIGLDELPDGWVVKWAEESEKQKRLEITSPNGVVLLEVYSIHYRIDKEELLKSDTRFYKNIIQSSYKTDVIDDYGKKGLKRSEFQTLSKKGKTIYSTVDIYFERGFDADWGYIITTDTFDKDAHDVSIAKRAIKLNSPGMTVFGFFEYLVIGIGGELLGLLVGFLIIICLIAVIVPMILFTLFLKRKFGSKVWAFFIIIFSILLTLTLYYYNISFYWSIGVGVMVAVILFIPEFLALIGESL